MNKQVANITFWSIAKSDMDWDITRLSRELLDTVSHCNAMEAKELHSLMFPHLIAIRDLVEKFDEQIEKREQAEHQAELAQREEVTLETVDGEKLKFNAPYGFECSPQRTIYSYDLYDLDIEDGKIIAAKAYTMGSYSSLTPEELDKCNSLLVRM
jgi:hypothetical protein